MSRESRKTQITHLLADPSLTHEQIAKAIGCSTKTVQRVARSILPDVQEADEKVAEYRSLIHKYLPIKDRVKLYNEIARKAGTNPFAALRALERADELDGIVTEQAKGRGDDQPEYRPMFNIGNAVISVTGPDHFRRRGQPRRKERRSLLYRRTELKNHE